MIIYEKLMEGVNKGKRFYINFETRKMKVGGNMLINEGVWNNEFELGVEKVPLEVCLQNIEKLYNEYKYSLPSKRSERKRKKYFKALSFEEIPGEYLIKGSLREKCQAALEGYVLCSVLNGNLYWDESVMGKWFWKSKEYPELILLKTWILGGMEDEK